MPRAAHKPRWYENSCMESLAGRVRKYNDTPGINYARAAAGPPSNRAGKDAARGKLIDYWRKYESSLSILTMPAVEWRFEKALLRNRETTKDRYLNTLRRTFITSLEREPAIYTAALKEIPGGKSGLAHLSGDVEGAVMSMRTPKISRFHCMSFEKFAEVNRKEFAAAWLDFTGPLTQDILEALPLFWPRVRHSIALTFLNARQSLQVSRRITAAGGSAELLLRLLPGAQLARTLTGTPIEPHSYFDGVPMLQVLLERKTSDEHE